MEQPPLLLAVDVGGTMTSGGAVTAAGEVVLVEVVPTHCAGPGRAVWVIEELIVQMRDAAERLGHRITGIGVGVPGPVDTVTGRISEHVPHVPELEGVALVEKLERRFRLPVFVDNDVNAMALDQWTFGGARGVRSLVVLAAGTGLGSGIVLNGRLVRGASGFGAELGHTPVKFDGPRCFCGGRGCGALYVSGRGIADTARARVAGDAGAALLRAAGGDLQAVTASLVFEVAFHGDPVAKAIVDEACQALGAIIGMVVNGLNPEVVVITGGLVASLAGLGVEIIEAAEEYALSQAMAQTRLMFVPSDKSVTIRGPAALVLYEMALREESR